MLEAVLLHPYPAQKSAGGPFLKDPAPFCDRGKISRSKVVTRVTFYPLSCWAGVSRHWLLYSMACDNIPPEMVHTMNPFCSSRRVA